MCADALVSPQGTRVFFCNIEAVGVFLGVALGKPAFKGKARVQPSARPLICLVSVVRDDFNAVLKMMRARW